MSLAQLKEEFVEVAQGLPYPPQFVRTPANDNDGNLLKVFEKDIAYYNGQLNHWFANVQNSVMNMRKVFEAAYAENPEYIILLLDELDRADRAIDLMVSHAKTMLETPEETREIFERLSKISREARRFVRKIEEMHKKSMLRFYRYVLNIKDDLNILRWDYDPDARGGVTFDNADDLMAHLNAL